MEQANPREKVAVVKYDGTFASFASALDLCDGLRGLKTTDNILLKPNLFWGGSRKDPQFGRVTTSTMVDHTLRALRERGCTDITIGEGTVINSELGSTTARGYRWSGIDKVARRYGVKLVDFNAGPHEEVELENIKVKVSSWALGCDFLIDLPVLKTHRMTQVSLGMKNLKGCLAFPSKQRFHRSGLHHLIAMLNTRLHPSLTIIDGIYGLERGPEYLGTAHRMDLIIAGTDVFSCDVVGASIMGIPPGDVEHLVDYAVMTGRTLSPDAIEVRGEPIDRVARKFEWRLSEEDVLRQAGITGVTIQEGDTTICSSCVALETALTSVLTKDCQDTSFEGMELCLGRKTRPRPESKKVFLVGDCAVRANKDRPDAIPLRGCPPKLVESVFAIAANSLPRRKAARVLTARMAKRLGMALGYSEQFAVWGSYEAPEFDRKHF